MVAVDLGWPNMKSTNPEAEEVKTCNERTVDLVPEWVSLSGLRQACDNSVPLWWRFFWVIVIIGGLVMSGYQIVIQALYYQSGPISVTISIENKVEMKFPPITFCNFNPARLSALEEHNMANRKNYFGEAPFGMITENVTANTSLTDLDIDWGEM